MKDVFPCDTCSNRIVTVTAGFIQYETSRCALFDTEIDIDDGCTFGDSEGASIGVVPYDIDLSATPVYVEMEGEY